MAKKRKKLTGTVKRIIKPLGHHEPEKAEVDINEADPLYREIRVENVVEDDHGKKTRLQEGEGVDLIIEVEHGTSSKSTKH